MRFRYRGCCLTFMMQAVVFDLLHLRVEVFTDLLKISTHLRDNRGIRTCTFNVLLPFHSRQMFQLHGRSIIRFRLMRRVRLKSSYADRTSQKPFLCKKISAVMADLESQGSHPTEAS